MAWETDRDKLLDYDFPLHTFIEYEVFEYVDLFESTYSKN